MSSYRIGTGFDAHAFAEGRPLVLGGVTVPHPRGLQGHSDADVLLHAVADALLGALALGDLGLLFPPSDPALKGIDSGVMLRQVMERVLAVGYRLANLDSTLVAQQPRLAPFLPEMRGNLARHLSADPALVSVKATTTEGLGFTGREEGIAAQAVVLLQAG